jgi:site-specific DNA-methyltransferase (adenine-specific)
VTFVCTDALSGLKSLKDKSIDLCVTSPPYSDIRKSYQGVAPKEYTQWFLPIATQILRVLKTNGSFVLNIKDKCEDGERIPYPFEIVIELRKLGFKFIDTIIWQKKNGATCAGRRRADYFEYIFHFCKGIEPVWNPDSIRTPYAASSKKRATSPIKQNTSNRESRTEDEYKEWVLNPLGAYPKNLIPFPKDSGRDHPASYHIDLPSHFIMAHSNPGDTVLDPFAGRGTTLMAAKILGRKGIGFELKPEYITLSKEVYPELWV